MKKLLILTAALIICNAYGENMTWLANNTVYSTSSCNSGGNISRPTNPTKSGYRFIGWREATINEILLINGTSQSPTAATGANTWSVTFSSYGTYLSGTSRCSSTKGSCSTLGGNCTKNSDPTINSNGPYCWCKLTNAGSLSSKINVSSLTWTFVADYTGYSCQTYCGFRCANRVNDTAAYRLSLFGIQ